MTKVVRRRDEPDRIHDHEDRIRALERRIREEESSAAVDTSLEILWAVDGAITTGVSNRYYFESAQTMSAFRVTLATTGSTATILELRKNGVAITTVTLAASTTTTRVAASATFASGDYYTIAITTAGTGAEDLQTQTEFA